MKPVSITGPHLPAETEPPQWFFREVARLKKIVARQRIKASTIATSIGVLVAVLLAMCGAGWAAYDSLRDEMHAGFAELREADAGLRSEMLAGFADLREADAGLRSEMQAGFAMLRETHAELRSEMQAGFAALREEMSLLRVEFGEEIRQLDRRVDELDVRVALAEQIAGLTPSSSADAASGPDIDSRIERQQVRLANIELRLDVLQGLLGQDPPQRDAAEAQRQLAATPHDETNLWVNQLLGRIDSVEAALTF